MGLGDNIRRLLKENDLTQVEFGEMLGVTESSVSLWVLGKCKPKKGRLQQIAELFDTDIEILTGDNMNHNLKTNGSGYYDPTAYTALREAIKKEREKRVQVLRGDIFYIKKWGDTTGSEQYAGRPAVIVSNDTGNRHSKICEIVYLTSEKKTPLPTHVDVMCTVPSTALCEQIVTISQERLENYVRSCTKTEMEAIDRALKISLALDGSVDYDEYSTVDEQADTKEIDDLKAELERAKAEQAESEKQLEEANQKIAQQKHEIDKRDAQILQTNSGNNICMEVERDFYKEKYEQLFNMMINRG